MELLSRLIKIFKKEKVKNIKPSLISLDSNPVPVGLFKTFTAGASISAGQVVSLYSDGKIYPSSSTYPNVVGVAIDTVSAGGNVRVLVLGVAQVVADGAISTGSFVTFSTATAGRVVAYGGHSHAPSTTTASAITSVSTTSATVVSGVSTTTGTFVTSVSTSTGTFVTGISVDRRDFTTGSAVTSVSTSSGTFLTGIGDDTGWYQDSAGYARHKHSTSTASALTGASTSTGSFVTGITSTAGTTVTANVSASTGSAVTGVSTSTASAVTGVSTSTTSVVGSVSTSSGTFVTGVSIGTTLSRVIGIALTSSTGAGQTITILILPSWI